MIALEVFGQTPTMSAVAERLHALDGVSRVRIEPAVRASTRSFSRPSAMTQPIGSSTN